MRAEEAQTLAEWVIALALPKGTVCLNIGSSTAQFREREQPHIQSRLIAPLERAGIRFVHCDMKPAPGVDEVGDLLDPGFRERLKRHKADMFLCSNVLEHVTDPQSFASACGELVPPGGFGLLSVPCSYPYHPDPIDTMLRVRPDQLAGMLPAWTIIRAAQLSAGSYWKDLKLAGRPIYLLAYQLARTLLPFYRPSHWRAIASRLLFLGRPYQVSLVMLQKPAAA